jgi:hypothetical protein
MRLTAGRMVAFRFQFEQTDDYPIRRAIDLIDTRRLYGPLASFRPPSRKKRVIEWA